VLEGWSTYLQLFLVLKLEIITSLHTQELTFYNIVAIFPKTYLLPEQLPCVTNILQSLVLHNVFTHLGRKLAKVIELNNTTL